MRTSATGTSTSLSRARASSRGFSLLELLVVVAIIGIVVGTVVLSMGVVGSDREIEREALRLRSLLDLLREEALMQTRDYGVLFSASGYRFYVYDYQRLTWVEPGGDALLREHELPPRLELALRVEERELVLRPSLEEIDDKTPEPQVMVLSSGEITPFSAEVARAAADGHYAVTAGLDGKLDVAAEGFDER